MLWFRHFPELESRSFRTVLVGLILEGAVSGLVADRTVEWMVDEQKLQIVLLGAAYQITRTLSSHDEAIRNILGTAGHQLGEKSNDLVSSNGPSPKKGASSSVWAIRRDQTNRRRWDERRL